MTTREFRGKLAQTHVSPKRSVVFGSGSIALRFADFRETGDVDLVISCFEFFRLWLLCGWRCVLPQSVLHWKEVRLVRDGCEAFLFWKTGRRFFPYGFVKWHSQCVDSLQCADLDLVKRYKRALGRDKDVRDLAFLRLRRE